MFGFPGDIVSAVTTVPSPIGLPSVEPRPAVEPPAVEPEPELMRPPKEAAPLVKESSFTPKSTSSSPHKKEILSWNGGKSLLTQAEEDREYDSRKRRFEGADDYNDQFDAGRGKKFKSHSQSQQSYRSGGGPDYRHQSRNSSGNGFQRFQNHKTDYARSKVSSGLHLSIKTFSFLLTKNLPSFLPKKFRDSFWNFFGKFFFGNFFL